MSCPGNLSTFATAIDFEHHTPLDRFTGSISLRAGGGQSLTFGPSIRSIPARNMDLETAGGPRVWFGRHSETMHIAPAVEYTIDPANSTRTIRRVGAAQTEHGGLRGVLRHRGEFSQPRPRRRARKVARAVSLYRLPGRRSGDVFKSAAVYRLADARSAAPLHFRRRVAEAHL